MENGGGWHGQGNGVDWQGGGDGEGEISQAEKVLMTAKEKPKKKDNKTWPAAELSPRARALSLSLARARALTVSVGR
jgi:hypothetical protein